ncbi:VOC family protein [Oleomonas cavernae]|uniref:VOC family protein n=1 Tax=Oleomonas cavernae TaxID=2320859 RepID=A0A418WSX3_9PROT|nr:VOC family protein [Oleomonas cavernae]RJF94351.1 VOC family protein [Oleomonas cavernae]
MRADRLDHLIWAAGDLGAGIDALEALSGVRAAVGGRHPGFGTRNALAALGPGLYLEILAPDPAQDRAGTLGGLIEAYDRPGLIGWAATGTDLPDRATRLPALGLASPGAVAMERTRPDGVRLTWSILGIGGHPFGVLVPFLIDWQGSPHPSLVAPAGLSLVSFSLRSPKSDDVRRLLGALGIEVVVTAGEPQLSATLRGPKGSFTLETVGTLPGRTFGL